MSRAVSSRSGAFSWSTGLDNRSTSKTSRLFLLLSLKFIFILFYIFFKERLFSFLSIRILFFCFVFVFELSPFAIIKIDDQIKLLKNSWIDILLLDLMWKQCRSDVPADTIVCVNDQTIKIGAIKHAQLGEICKAFMRCVGHFKSVSWHYAEYLALKYLVLFDPGKRPCLPNKIRTKKRKKTINLIYVFIRCLWYKQFGDDRRSATAHLVGAC